MSKKTLVFSYSDKRIRPFTKHLIYKKKRKNTNVFVLFVLGSTHQIGVPAAQHVDLAQKVELFSVKPMIHHQELFNTYLTMSAEVTNLRKVTKI